MTDEKRLTEELPKNESDALLDDELTIGSGDPADGEPTSDDLIKSEPTNEGDDLLDSGLTIESEEEPEENADLALTRKVNSLALLLRKYYTKAAKGDVYQNPLRGQGRVLALLAMKPETTQKELQFFLGMKQQSLSELLAKLETKGFIEREKSTEDGRVTIVRLTEAGAEAASNPDGAQPSGAYDCFDEEERARFEQDIDTLRASLAEKLECEADVSADEHGEEEGEQKRHRYGQQGRGGRGNGRGGGHGAGSGGHADGGHAGGGTKGKGHGASAGAGSGKGHGASTGSGSGKGHGAGAGSSAKRGGGRSGSTASTLASIASAATGSSSLGDIATRVLKEAAGASGATKGRGGRGGGGHGRR